MSDEQRNDSSHGQTVFGQHSTYDPTACVVFSKTKEDFGGLSNMAGGFALRINGERILTSEALYQACRFPGRPDIQREIIDQASPMAAKMKGKPHRSQTRLDWDEVRVDLMRWCLQIKLAQNWIEFRRLLLATRERVIVELSHKDDFWGAKVQKDGKLKGANVLGVLLGELREAVKKDEGEELRRVEPLQIPEFLLFGKPINAIDFRPSVTRAAK